MLPAETCVRRRRVCSDCALKLHAFANGPLGTCVVAPHNNVATGHQVSEGAYPCKGMPYNTTNCVGANNDPPNAIASTSSPMIWLSSRLTKHNQRYTMTMRRAHVQRTFQILTSCGQVFSCLLRSTHIHLALLFSMGVADYSILLQSWAFSPP